MNTLTNNTTASVENLDQLADHINYKRDVNLFAQEGIDTEALNFVLNTQLDGNNIDSWIEQYQVLKGLNLVKEEYTKSRGSLVIQSTKWSDSLGYDRKVMIDTNNEAYDVLTYHNNPMANPEMAKKAERFKINIEIKSQLKSRRAEKKACQKDLVIVRESRDYKKTRVLQRQLIDCTINIKRLSSYLNKINKRSSKKLVSFQDKLEQVRSRIQDAFVIEDNTKRSDMMETVLLSLDDRKGEAYNRIVSYVASNRTEDLYRKLGV